MINDQQQHLVRQGFKYFNRFMLLNWRLGLGPYLSLWPRGLGRYLVLIHTGRKTGLQRRTPVNYAAINGDFYVTAGFGSRTHWYQNIMAQPQIEIWTADGWWQVTAEDITGQPGHTAIMREVLKNSGFAAFAAGVNPYRLSDAELDTATESYRLLRLHPTGSRGGRGGPGDLAWMLPVGAGMVALVAVWRANRR